jgi:hypothetical protein
MGRGVSFQCRNFIKRHLSGDHEATAKMNTFRAAAYRLSPEPLLETRQRSGNRVQSKFWASPATREIFLVKGLSSRAFQGWESGGGENRNHNPLVTCEKPDSMFACST